MSLIDVKVVGFTNIGTSYTGNSPIGENDIDKRFRAPETEKCILDHRSDIYSLGMVMLLMLTGYPKVIQTEHYSIDFGSGTVDLTDVSSMDFYKALWKQADKSLSSSLRLILRKATDLSPSGRFATVEKFNEFTAKFAKRQIKTETVTEEQSQNNPVPAYGYRGGSQPVVPLIEAVGIVGTTKAKEKDVPKVKALDEVAGMEDLKALFRRDFIRIVRNPKVAQAYGIKPSNCTLLYGPQGCGKTFIAEKAGSGIRPEIQDCESF